MTKDYLARQFKNYHEITGDVVTPEMFGAVGDGVTDDTSAISQALNSGSVVYIPKGKYLVSWGKININDSTKDIIIYGDGEDSILLFNPLHKNPDTGVAAHGFMIRNSNNSLNRVNIYIHDIQIKYENSDTSITYLSDEVRLFGCVGYFKNIILDHVYMRDSITTPTTPKDSLMWLQVDADNVIVSNSKFENFTNNTIGGCVWINSGYFGVNYHINNISIINNILRNTNQDEAIAVWALPEGLLDVDTLMIDGNEIVHKNWNGECVASHSVIGIATLSNGSVTNKSYTISNNTIVTEKISQGVIRNIGVDKLLISDNTITIPSADSNATTINLIENYKNAYSVVKDNHIEITGVTKKLILFSQQSNIDYINNVFETSNNIQLASYGDDNYDVQKVLNFIGNTIVFRTPTTSLFEINNHGIWLTMNIVNNKVNGGLRLIANGTQNTNVQNNIFNIDNGVSTVALEVSKVLSFIDNKNIILEINNTNISTKLTAFKYSGLKNGLVFKVDGSVVDDSPEVRATFFVYSDIVYINDNTTYTAGNGIDITNNTVSLNSATQSILNGLGTAATKNSTDRVSPNNTDLVESQSVYSAINTALSSIYTPRGDITCAELTSDLLIEANVGNVYETSDSGTTTALFLQGAGVPIATGTNVGVINAGQGRILFNLMANAFDLTGYQKVDLTNAVEGQTTVEGALGALSTNKQAKDLTTAVESATTVEGALGALSDNKQAKTLTTSVESQTTVEGALSALSTNKATQTSLNTEISARAELGAHNLLNVNDYKSLNGLSLSNGIFTNTEIDSKTTLSLFIDAYASNGTTIDNILSSQTISTTGTKTFDIIVPNNTAYLKIGHNGSQRNLSADIYFSNTGSFKFSINVVSYDVQIVGGLSFKELQITDPNDVYVGYQPYAMTNKQLTDNKADKVSSATNGDLASLDANGNLVDSGVVASYVIRRVNISTSDDCNNLIDVFTEYRVGDNVTNRPTTDSTAYILRTFRSGTSSTTYSQIAYRIGGVATYRRYCNSSGTWSSWEKLVTESDLIVTANGDNSTAVGTNVASSWRITSNGSLCICYGVNTEAFNASAVSMTSMQLPSGYVFDYIISANVFVDGDTAWAVGASHISGNGAGTYITRSGVVTTGSFRQIVLAHKA